MVFKLETDPKVPFGMTSFTSGAAAWDVKMPGFIVLLKNVWIPTRFVDIDTKVITVAYGPFTCVTL